MVGGQVVPVDDTLAELVPSGSTPVPHVPSPATELDDPPDAVLRPGNAQ